MIGHSKFCITVIGGFVIFGDPVSTNQVLAILLAVCGLTIYTILKVRQQNVSNTETTQEIPEKSSQIV